MRIKINAINGPIYEVNFHHGQEIMVSQDIADRWSHVTKLFWDAQEQMRSFYEYSCEKERMERQAAEEKIQTAESKKIIGIEQLENAYRNGWRCSCEEPKL